MEKKKAATDYLERYSRNQRKSKPQRRRARRENTEIWDTEKRGWIARAYAAPEGRPAARGDLCLSLPGQARLVAA